MRRKATEWLILFSLKAANDEILGWLLDVMDDYGA